MKKDVQLDKDLVAKAAAALLQHLKENKAKHTQRELIEGDETISLIIALKRIPDKMKAKPIQIPLTHSLAAENQDICVFTKDPQTDFKKMFQELAITGVSKVISLTKLRKNYKSYEAKRQLCDSYDLFLTDDRIVTFLPPLLGKAFFKKKRNPVPIDLRQKNIAEQVRRAADATYMHLSTGACLNIKIALSSFTAAQVTDNILNALPTIVDHIPRKWKSIQSLHIKSSESVALPIYNALPEAMSVISTAAPSAQPKKRKEGPASAAHSESADDDDSSLETPAKKPKTPTAAPAAVAPPPSLPKLAGAKAKAAGRKKPAGKSAN